MSSLNPVSIGMQVREPLASYHGISGKALATRAVELLDAVGISSPRPGCARFHTSSPVDAPARRRRDGHLGATAALARGRADDEPRPDDPGPVPSVAQGSPGASSARDDLRHAQSGHRREDVRSRRGDVRGAHRGGGTGRDDLQRAGTRTRAPCSRRCRGSAPGRSGSPRSKASRPIWRRCRRLRVRAALRSRDGALSRGGAAEFTLGVAHASRCWLDGAGMSAALLEADALTKHFPVRRGLLGRTAGLVRAVDLALFTIEAGKTLGLVGESPRQDDDLLDDPQRRGADAGGDPLDGALLSELDREPLSPGGPGRVSRPVWLARPAHAGRDRRRAADHQRAAGGIGAGRRVLEPSTWSGWSARPSSSHEFSGGQRQRIAIARALALAQARRPRRAGVARSTSRSAPRSSIYRICSGGSASPICSSRTTWQRWRT